MRRLRELLDAEGAEQRDAAELLSRVSPLDRSLERRQRVWQTLQAKPRPRWARPLLFAPAFCVVATAGAAIAGFWPNFSEPSHAQTTLPLAAQASTRQNEAAGSTASVAAKTAPTAEQGAAALAGAAQPSDRPRVRAAPVRGPRAEASQGDTTSSPEAMLMLEAMRARRGGDSERAERLATEYRRKYPAGALGEEALVLVFETAAGRHSPEAPELARQYLAQFPNGRFRERARRVLESRVQR